MSLKRKRNGVIIQTQNNRRKCCRRHITKPNNHLLQELSFLSSGKFYYKKKVAVLASFQDSILIRHCKKFIRLNMETEVVQVDFENKTLKNMAIYIYRGQVSTQYYLTIMDSQIFIHKQRDILDPLGKPFSLSSQTTTIVKGQGVSAKFL